MEIRIRQRKDGNLSQETYEVSEEVGIAIMNICENAVSRPTDATPIARKITLYANGEPTLDATPIEFGCNEDGCKI